MGITKKNGSKLNRTNKKISQKCKTTYPKFRFGPKQKNGMVKFISYKKQNVFLKDQIVKVLTYPVPSYRSKKYLIPHAIVSTKLSNKVKIKSINEGRLIGQIVD